ncbi:ImmA/IrrE family metallo-endopeptidase [Fusobacterium vincentii]|uniref:ImmA/IrrE family metallo-endopeptidase n=1 Tax=Fusobacterium vincentii TaxID=155615 RepID=UPI003247BB2C
MDIRLKVLDLIIKYGTKNPFKLAKKLNIEILIEDLGEVRGLFKKILKKKFIFINSKLNEFDRMLVCAHELGHAILHSSTNYQFLIDNTSLLKRSRLEDEANLFASYLIFPDGEEIEIEYRETKTNIWIFEEIKRLRKF